MIFVYRLDLVGLFLDQFNIGQSRIRRQRRQVMEDWRNDEDEEQLVSGVPYKVKIKGKSNGIAE